MLSNKIEKHEIESPLDIEESDEKLSPMEQSILKELSSSEKTTQELASSLNTSEGSVGKQLSKLMKKSLVNITKQDRPKKYGLIK